MLINFKTYYENYLLNKPIVIQPIRNNDGSWTITNAKFPYLSATAKDQDTALDLLKKLTVERIMNSQIYC